MTFSKNLLDSDFRPLIGVTCKGQKFFFIGFLLAKNVKTLFSKTAKSIYKFYKSNESL